MSWLCGFNLNASFHFDLGVIVFHRLKFLVLAVFVCLMPVGLAAQPVSDSLANAPPVASPADLAQYAFTLVLGIVTPWLYKGLERVAPFLMALNPTAKRALVSLIPGGVALGIAWASTQWAWIPIDPTVASAAVASAIAFAVHAGDTAKDAKDT